LRGERGGVSQPIGGKLKKKKKSDTPPKKSFQGCCKTKEKKGEVGTGEKKGSGKGKKEEKRRGALLQSGVLERNFGEKTKWEWPWGENQQKRETNNR